MEKIMFKNKRRGASMASKGSYISNKDRSDIWIGIFENDYNRGKINKKRYVELKSRLLSERGFIGKIKGCLFKISNIGVYL